MFFSVILRMRIDSTRDNLRGITVNVRVSYLTDINNFPTDVKIANNDCCGHDPILVAQQLQGLSLTGMYSSVMMVCVL